MEVALLILPLIGGYFFAINWLGLKYTVAREDGHRLYFRAAFCGAIFFIMLYILHLVVVESFPPYRYIVNLADGYLKPFFPDQKYSKPPTDFVLTAVYSLLFGYCLAKFLNLFYNDKSKDKLLSKAIESDEFESLLHRVIRKNIPICITMDNSKVYVGIVKNTTKPDQTRRAISIWPYMSGFRAKDTGKMEFTTYYDKIYDKIQEEMGKVPANAKIKVKPEEFEIVIPTDKIASISIFDLDVWELFQSNSRQ